VAEAGLVGLPNAGKSTLLAALSAARPKIAPYPFTTLTPNIGRVFVSDEESFTVADIPGLIEGAHLGHGLGIRFLRHLSRTRLLVFVLDITADPEHDFDTVRGEIAAFDPELLKRPSLIALNKIDLVSRNSVEPAARAMRERSRLEVFPISAQEHIAIEPMVAAIAAHLRTAEQQAECRS
jgi:GTP-binding protein